MSPQDMNVQKKLEIFLIVDVKKKVSETAPKRGKREKKKKRERKRERERERERENEREKMGKKGGRGWQS